MLPAADSIVSLRRNQRRHLAAVAIAIAIAMLSVGLSACGSAAPPSGGAFRLSGDSLQLQLEPDQPSPWEVEVATARSEVAAVVVHRDPPADVEPGNEATPAVATAGADLTPIPSDSLSWGSAEVDGGWVFDNPTNSLNPMVFLITEDHDEWLRVMIPARPNQQTGWIKTGDVIVTTHQWHMEINVTTNVLRAWDGDELRIETLSVGGRPSTPTPLGRYYVNEKQAHEPSSVYGTWIISTNGFSDTLERFSGEVPIFAVHGTNRPQDVGQDISNGCVRVPNDIATFLAENIPAGTPIDIVA